MDILIAVIFLLIVWILEDKNIIKDYYALALSVIIVIVDTLYLCL